MRRLTITAHQAGQRLDNYLIRVLPKVPRSHVYRLLRSGQVRVNGGRAKPDRRLESGDEVRIPPVRQPEPGAPVRPPDALLERLCAAVVHEDEHYLVLNKPAGVAAHAGSGLHYGVIEAVRAWRRYEFIELAHRLDRDTSGVLLLAKSRGALLRAHAALRSGGAQKRYLALLCGALGAPKSVDAALLKNRLRGGERRVELDEEGKMARSRFVPVRRFKGATLAEVTIDSGRTHQIRVHALALGHPVAGDRKYGAREAQKWIAATGLKRMFLHAWTLRLPAADGFAELAVEARLPEELEVCLERLRPLPPHPDPLPRGRGDKN